ncbi:MFS transporter [Nocardiopsis terrae]|uniref:MFS family permease n=1 Tax=Nocardiopsis terrae TaxID=372655 RepID=A0ABR9HF38_9ACTN|nr:MFS transporter [Nocardiopsis terrae]MBE1457645.1 MFS family permease [Nocardiopsis terrae]GHC85000.1 MFS transporter [Nocardiopsis terrae]
MPPAPAGTAGAAPPNTPPPDTPPPTAGTAPRDRRLSGTFHRFWGAGVFTNLGDGMILVALPLIATTLTQDPFLVSGLTATRFLPWLLLSPLSGLLIDRVNRMRAMAVANAAAALTMLALAGAMLTGHLSIWLLYAAMFVVIACETVSDPASRIAVVELVPARLLDRANSRLEGGRLVAQDCLGRPVAGFLFAAGAVAPLLGIAGAYALCAVLLCAIPLVWRRHTPPPGPDGADAGAGAEGSEGRDRQGFLRSLGEGFRMVFTDRILRGNMLCNAGLMIGMNMTASLLGLYAQNALGVPITLFGLFLLSSAVGGVLGSLVAARLLRRVGRRTVVTRGYAGAGLFLVAAGLATEPRLAFLALAGVGFCVVVSNVAAGLYFQTVVPNAVRGRIAGASKTIGWGLAPVGALLGGLLGRIDLALPYLVGGAVILLATFLARRIIAETARLADEAAARLTTEAAGR